MKTRSSTPSKHTSSVPLDSPEVRDAVLRVFASASSVGKRILQGVSIRTKGQCALCARALPNDFGHSVAVLNGEHYGEGLFSFEASFGIESTMEEYSMCICPCCASDLKSYAFDTFGPGAVYGHVVGDANVLILPYRVVYEFIRSSANAFYMNSKVSGTIGFKTASDMVESGILDRDWIISPNRHSLINMRHGQFILRTGFQLCRVLRESKTDVQYLHSVDDFISTFECAYEKGLSERCIP